MQYRSPMLKLIQLVLSEVKYKSVGVLEVVD